MAELCVLMCLQARFAFIPVFPDCLEIGNAAGPVGSCDQGIIGVPNSAGLCNLSGSEKS